MAHKGAIVRIRLVNFMTYNNIEIWPGPNLNMILGPNGTGKSAIVCSIIVGLAGEVSLTGRASTPAGLVKKGASSGSTEIELFNPNGHNFIIERKIIITGTTGERLEHRSEWKINQEKVLKARVQELTKELSIKVDNLCQFLPQDSVTSFVKMDSRDLLSSTLEAAGDSQLVIDHRNLIDRTKDVETKRAALEMLMKQCHQNEIMVQRLETEVEQLKTRDKLVKEKNNCSLKIYYVRYLSAVTDNENLQGELAALKTTLRTLEGNSDPFKRDIEKYRNEENRLRQALSKSNDELRSLERKLRSVLDLIEARKVSCREEFLKFKAKEDVEKRRDEEVLQQGQELESLECRFQEIAGIDYSKEIADAEAVAKARRDKLFECLERTKSNNETLSRQVIEENKTKNELDQILAVSERKKNLLVHKSSAAHRALEWYTKNQSKFRENILMPLMCEINVKNPKHAAILEHIIPSAELTAFVCQNDQDLKVFTQMVYEHLRVRVNVILAPEKTMREFEAEARRVPNYSHLGIRNVKHLIDLIDAPDPILRYLCGNYQFHKIPVMDEVSESQLKKLYSECPKFYVGDNFYASSRSRYDGQIMYVSDSVREARCLIFSLDIQRLGECRKRLASLQELRSTIEEEKLKIAEDHGVCQKQWDHCADHLRDLKLKDGEKQRLSTLIRVKKSEIERLNLQRINLELERRKLRNSVDKINVEIVEHLSGMTQVDNEYVKLRKRNLMNMILAKRSNRNHQLARLKYNNSVKDTARVKDEIRMKEAELVLMKKSLAEAKSEAEERIEGFNNGKLSKSFQIKFDAILENSVDALEYKRAELAAQIRTIYQDSTTNVMGEYRKQVEELKDRRLRIGELEASIASIDGDRNTIKSDWRGKVEKVLAVVNKHYRDFMRKLGYDGQVKLDFDIRNPDNFAVYGVKILVKFRDTEELIPLSATRQSGGERSVATMIYMLALQTQTTVPFRCVDEINQGMDKENERKVFELLVRTADSSSSQYFLVSPKLLPNLPYSEKMKIHVVFNGNKLHVDFNDFCGKSHE